VRADLVGLRLAAAALPPADAARAPHAFSSSGNPHQAWSEKIVLSLTAALALCALCC